MIRLSRKAWNNVIIFAMLIMILLFNSTTNILNNTDSDNSAKPLLPEGSVLMTLESNGFKVERIGSGWRIKGGDSEVQIELNELVSRWQDSIMHPIDTPDSVTQPDVVVAWLAGEQNGRVYQLYSSDNDTLVAVNDQYYRIHNTPIRQLTIQP